MPKATQNTAARIKTRIEEGWHRLNEGWLYIIQAAVAAGLSYWVAAHVVGNPDPFFAPMATIIVLSTTGGERFRRAMELVVGVSVGVGIGDLMIAFIGSGVWQIAVAVAVAIAFGRFLDKGVLVANQAAFASVLIATILPPGTTGGTDRMLDAFIGGLVGLAVIAVFPESPLKQGRKEISMLMGVTSRVLDQVAFALKTGDTEAIRTALQEARGTQGGINNMIAAAKAGAENLTVSPLLWRQRPKIRSLLRILNPVDNAIRNTRVLARRALVLSEDHDEVSTEQIAIIAELADVSLRLQELFSGGEDAHKEMPELIKRLRVLGNQARLEVAEGKVLSAQMILGQSRSIIVDLLQICGLSRRSAVAILRPTSEHPGQPPELWENDGSVAD
ncbi:MAG: FUSC family protein [Corynebacterium sp.]|uniref:FUSC family protein n=1 Tax=Corynebacterium sp. TaxID=1720 RepID=UPI0026DC23B8|nr:FUSC family protein [Corynebacterium sp.]MDO5097446.1 FUSC family protein [Corynebacterium sp.]